MCMLWKVAFLKYTINVCEKKKWIENKICGENLNLLLFTNNYLLVPNIFKEYFFITCKW